MKRSELLRGGRNPRAKLTDFDIVEIRLSTKKPHILAKRFSTTPGYIRDIRSRKVWKHL